MLASWPVGHRGRIRVFGPGTEYFREKLQGYLKERFWGIAHQSCHFIKKLENEIVSLIGNIEDAKRGKNYLQVLFTFCHQIFSRMPEINWTFTRFACKLHFVSTLHHSFAVVCHRVVFPNGVVSKNLASQQYWSAISTYQTSEYYFSRTLIG